MQKNTRLTLIVAFICMCACIRLYAIKDETNQERWEKPCTIGPDAVVPGFLVNMGPAGARGILKTRSFVVKYIFPKSPAKGVLKLNDEVTGANGKKFAAHTFSGSSGCGIVGPIQDMGVAIEDSEGRDGILKLTVERDGSPLKVSIQLEKLGRFADTFPVNCKKTDILKERAYKYLMDNPGGVSSQGRCVEILAMLSSDDSRVSAEGKRLAKAWNSVPGKNTWSWHLGFQGITLAEYYLLTGDRSVLKTLESVLNQLRYAQWKGPKIQRWEAHGGADQATTDRHQALYEGGFGHEPYPEIVSRAGGGYGGGGYGPMQRPTYLAILAWQLGKQCGLEVKHPGLETAFQFVEYGTRVSGNTAYGGEFTLNNGPVDPVKWKQSTSPGNSHKSGMAYLLYRLSPERSNSEMMMKRHLHNIGASYRDMPDGHACPMMGLVWGWAGVYASQDDDLKKKITDYFVPWINMARCHGSDSYVILPGRNYADGSYYRGNIRNHTTASIAFLYSYSTPKLQLQGISPVIPGIAHTDLSPGAMRVYDAIKNGHTKSALLKIPALKKKVSGKDLEQLTSLENYALGPVLAAVDDLVEVHKSGDVYKLRAELTALDGRFQTIPAYEEKVKPLRYSLATPENKKLLKLGSLYNRVFTQGSMASRGKKPPTKGEILTRLKECEETFGLSVYSSMAKARRVAMAKECNVKLAQAVTLMKTGDLFAAVVNMKALDREYGLFVQYRDAVIPVKEKLNTPDARRIFKIGHSYQSLLKKAALRPGKYYESQLRAFGAKYADTFYGKEATRVAPEYAAPKK